MQRSSAKVIYQRRIGLLSAMYVLAMVGGMYAVKAGSIRGAATVAVALAAGLSVAGMFWAVGRLILDEQDEFQRLLIVRQALFATGFALSAAAIHGFLSAFDLVPRIDLYWVPILWFLGLGLGHIVNRVKFGAWGPCP